jgi:hypothetical protein
MIPAYPHIIPELSLSGEEQLHVNTLNFKFRLVSTFLYKKILVDELIYIEQVRTKKKNFNPLFSMSRALAYYNDYCKKEKKEDLETFKIIAKKLINKIQTKDNLSGWKHHNAMQLPGYPPKKEAYSALNNARGLGVLIRYYQYQQKKELLNHITGILNSFEQLSSQGGVQNPEGFYLEYSWGDDSPIVWNGFMSALVGLYDCSVHGPTKGIRDQANKLFATGADLLVKHQEKLFWKGRYLSWIRYDTNKLYFADGAYMNIELKQLAHLSRIDNRLTKIYNKMKTIHTKNKQRASVYEYYYFIKKRMMQ